MRTHLSVCPMFLIRGPHDGVGFMHARDAYLGSIVVLAGQHSLNYPESFLFGELKNIYWCILEALISKISSTKVKINLIEIN